MSKQLKKDYLIMVDIVEKLNIRLLSNLFLRFQCFYLHL